METEISGSLVAVIIGGIVTIIGVLVPGIVSIITALRATKQQVAETQAKVLESKAIVDAATQDQNKKLDDITTLVDGRYSAVLNELATMKELFSHATGLPSDKKLAEDARTAAVAQETRVDVIKNGVKNGKPKKE